MKWWKRIALSLAVIIFELGSFLAYRAIAKHRDLQETLLWMDQTYNPHEGGDNLGHPREHPLQGSRSPIPVTDPSGLAPVQHTCFQTAPGREVGGEGRESPVKEESRAR